MFKDCEGINRKQDEEKNIEALYHKCESAIQPDGSLDKERLRYELGIDEGLIEDKSKTHNHEHEGCKGCDTSTRTEKRVCRCIYYSNSNKKRDCDNCQLRLKKWKKQGNISIVDYEIPMKSVYKKVGGIDLILEYEDTLYGAEVKPWYSTETISRMVAETLTYTSAIEDRYKPAILVFEKSSQHKSLIKLENNKYWKGIIEFTKVKVFIISTPGIDLNEIEQAERINFVIEEYK